MRRTVRRLLATITLLALIVGACGGEASPDEVLADYAEARNSGDVDGVMEFYAKDAIVENHPLDDDGVATGTAEIRALEEQIPAVQGSGDGQEIIDMVVSGNTVTFNTRFFYGADGTRNSSGEPGCAGGRGHQVTVEDGKITLYVGGPESPTLCTG
jgi:ketosteroid isomerase-like protein